jgi:photosystem II stability/assembly factor-like uncharacterized protein
MRRLALSAIFALVSSFAQAGEIAGDYSWPLQPGVKAADLPRVNYSALFLGPEIEVYDSALAEVTCIDPIVDGIAVAGLYNGGHILRTTDYGVTWSLATDTPAQTFRGFAYCGNGIVVGFGPSYIVRSIDYGATWNIATTSASIGAGPRPTYIGNSTILGGGASGILYKSTDCGANWSLVPGVPQYTFSSITDIGGGVILAQGASSTAPLVVILRSTDAGDHWSVITPSLVTIVSAVYGGRGILKFNDGVAVSFWAGSALVYRTTDFGQTWNYVYGHPTESQAGQYADVGNGIAVFHTYPSGLNYISRDYGETWNFLEDLEYTPGRCYFGKGVFCRGSAATGKIFRTKAF